MLTAITLDRNFKGYPLAYCMCSKENQETYETFLSEFKNLVDKTYEIDYQPKYIITDGAIYIRNACQAVF